MAKGILTRNDMANIIREAHEYCKKNVPITVGKRRLSRSRSDYLACLKQYIRNRVAETLKAKGYNVKTA